MVGLRRQIEPSTSRACFNELAEPPVVGDELCGVRGGADGRLLLDAFTEITREQSGGAHDRRARRHEELYISSDYFVGYAPPGDTHELVSTRPRRLRLSDVRSGLLGEQRRSGCASPRTALRLSSRWIAEVCLSGRRLVLGQDSVGAQDGAARAGDLQRLPHVVQLAR